MKIHTCVKYISLAQQIFISCRKIFPFIHYFFNSFLFISLFFCKQVKAVYLAACQLKMDRVVKECIQHLIKNLNIENCIETRSLPGIAKNREFVAQVDRFIANEVSELIMKKKYIYC